MNVTKRYAAVTQGEFSTTVFGERSVCCRFFGESREIVCDLSETAPLHSNACRNKRLGKHLDTAT